MVVQDAEAWAANELRALHIPDARLERRAIRLLASLSSHPEESLPKACEGKWAATKGAYRFLSNPRVDPDALLGAHIDATVRRVQDRPLILVAHDTSTLNYTTHPQAAASMGPVGAHNQKQMGLLLHSALAIDPQQGEPLGLLAARVWVRRKVAKPKRKKKPETPGTRRARRVLISTKESFRWLQTVKEVAGRLPAGTTAVFVSDRESDIYEYVDLAVREGHRVLLRAVHDRSLDGDQGRLLQTLAATAPLGTADITVPRADGHPERQACLTLRVAEVTLAAPQGKRTLMAPHRVTAILAAEEQPPEGSEAVRWLLLTTLAVPDLDAALRCVRWYCLRWRIERFHYVLKSGCQIEQLQLSHLTRIQRALALYIPVACRLLRLTYAARCRPEDPCTEMLDPDEWRALACYILDRPIPPRRPPNLKTAVRWLAEIGGFLGRKGDGDPGVKALWSGLRMLPRITRMWRTMNRRR